MKFTYSIFFSVFLLLVPGVSCASEINSLRFGNFGNVSLYKGTGSPKRLVLFASGDGGWNLGVIDMAKAIAEEGVVVAGFSTVSYIKQSENKGGKCLYPAGDLELLSKYIQKKLGFKEYSHPILVGYSSGATFVYGAVAQAPKGTFDGAISLGFCSDIDSKISLCKGFGLESRPIKNGYDLSPSSRELNEWSVLHGDQDKVCSLEVVKKFVSATKGALLVSLPKVGHGFSVQKNWMPQFKERFSKLQVAKESSPLESSLEDLPLLSMEPQQSQGNSFVIFLSGDGGWAEFDQKVSKAFLEKGLPVVGFNSLKYFWNAKTPEQGAKDLERIIVAYSKKWKKTKVVVVGFSFGADVAPAFVNRLTDKARNAVQKVVLISAGEKAEFEFHFADWLTDRSGGSPLKPEIASIAKKTKVICLYGEDEAAESGCPTFAMKNVEAVKLPGGHHIEIKEDQLDKMAP